MKVLGITGGIGSGKSTVMEMLKNRYGAVVLLADDIGHTAMDKDTVTFRKMTEARQRNSGADGEYRPKYSFRNTYVFRRKTGNTKQYCTPLCH